MVQTIFVRRIFSIYTTLTGNQSNGDRGGDRERNSKLED